MALLPHGFLMDCPECERLIAAYSFAAREIANAMLAREETSKDDTEALQGIADRIEEMEKARLAAHEALDKHMLTHSQNGC
jgi:hypothetical protein